MEKIYNQPEKILIKGGYTKIDELIEYKKKSNKVRLFNNSGKSDFSESFADIDPEAISFPWNPLSAYNI